VLGERRRSTPPAAPDNLRPAWGPRPGPGRIPGRSWRREGTASRRARRGGRRTRLSDVVRRARQDC